MYSNASSNLVDRARATLIAAAVGDALGWPYERRDRTRKTEQGSAMAGDHFFSWSRNAGTRFHPLEEVVAAGSYSDDTQMIIAVARARLVAGDDWNEWLRSVELPFFLLYERGAGATVKRSSSAWARGRPPWHSPRLDEREKYFSSGANGAAMRVSPHVLARSSNSKFDSIGQDVMADAVLTHGHARAHVGAQLYAYALWLCLNQSPPLSYGWLIHALLDMQSEWSKLHATSLSEDWLEASSLAFGRDYSDAWAQAVVESTELLTLAAAALQRGAVSTPGTFLRELGAMNPKTKGSGTISAVAASFLAAQSAARPADGLRVTARMEGTDTDTLASMAGGLLGAMLGSEWLGGMARSVQDGTLLYSIAEKLVVHDPAQEKPPLNFMRRAREFRNGLDFFSADQSIKLPDGRPALVKEVVSLDDHQTHRITIQSQDGQTLYFIRRSGRESDSRLALSLSGRSSVGPGGASTPLSLISAIEVPVLDVAKVCHALAEVFALYPESSGKKWAAFPGGLLVTQDPDSSSVASHNVRLRLQTHDIDAVRQRAVRHGLEVKTSPVDSGHALEILLAPGVMVVVRRRSLG